MVETFDLIIVGSGSGNSIPEYLSEFSIAIVERGTFGGTCLNVGCIPSKMLVLPADAALLASDASHLGVTSRFESVDWPSIRDRIFGRIDAISEGGRNYRAEGTPNVTLLTGTARFVGDRTLAVQPNDDLTAEPRIIQGRQILLAAGARPIIPNIDGIDDIRYHTSDTIMRLDALPRRLGIMGGGFIAAEMGHVFAAYGTEVTIFTRSGHMLTDHDREVATRFTEQFSERITFRPFAKISQLRQGADGIEITDGEDTIEVDEFLIAIGREPNTDLLDAASGGVTTHPDGRIIVDGTMATAAPGVWAIGDICDPHQLKHVANAQARIAFWNIAHGNDIRQFDSRVIPAAVFGEPQIAAVGWTEEQAQAAGIAYKVGRRDYAGTAYGWALVDESSFAKVLVDPATDLILGAHIIGPQAATLIQPIIQAMAFQQTATEVATGMLYIHPALTEVVENALLDAIGSE